MIRKPHPAGHDVTGYCMIATGSRVAARLAVVLACHLGVVMGLPDAAAAEERQLFMFVMNLSDQQVLDLRADEVRVQQTGGECKVVSLQPEIDGMKIALIVDNSGAVANSLTALRDGLLTFLDELPAKHEIGLFTIGGQVRQRVGFTTDREALAAQVDRLFAENNTTAVLIDGLLETWDRRFDAEDAWPVFVLVVYDGPEASNLRERKFNEFQREPMARGATAHSILVSTHIHTHSGGGLQTIVSVNLAENTGGVHTSLAAPTALPKGLTELARTMAAHYDEAKNRYRVVFECDPDNPSVPINVVVTRPAVAVRLFADRRANR